MNKVIYFRDRTDTPLKVVKDKGEGCAPCFFKGHPGGCPEKYEEIRAGAGYGCLRESHYYVEAKCEG